MSTRSLDFAIETRSVRAPVLSVAKGTLKVRLPGSLGAMPGIGARLDAAALTGGVGPVRWLSALVVDAIDVDEQGAVATLDAADDGTRAGLWLELGNPAAGARASAGPESAWPRIPERGVHTEDARRLRLTFLHEETGSTLSSLQTTSLAADRLSGNIENLIGSVEVPVGVVGPLWFKGRAAQGPVYAPFATTEGALVASATRGATAISSAGGVATAVLGQQMMRVPLFVFSEMQGALFFAAWVRDHAEEIRAQTRRVSSHAELTAVDPAVMGRMVNVSFLYRTGDAAGQNMTTSCTWHACQWILRQIPYLEGTTLENFLIEGAMSGDKKVTFRSFLSGRGTRVTAECRIDRATLLGVLKVTPEQILEAHGRGLAGSALAGMVGHNVNVANTIAALFTATGQDIACVHESSVAQLHLEPAADGIYASILLPSLIVGSVGGGTHLPRQNDCLRLLGCAGPDKAFRLAEIVAGFSLATDLSTLAAVAGGQFAAAHDRLGRSRAVRWLERDDLTPAFFEPGLRRACADDALTVREARLLDAAATGSSIITELTARTVRKVVGLFPYRLSYRTARAAGDVTLDVMVKIKPTDQEVMLAANGMAAMCGPRLRGSYSKFKDRTGLAGCHVRELGVYEQEDPRLRRHMPRVYGAVRDDSREAYVLVLERLADVALLDTADDISGWRAEHVEAALRGIAEVHAVWYRREQELLGQPWLGPVPSAAGMADLIELWDDLGAHAADEFPEWVSPADLALHRRLVRTLPEWWSRLEAMPKTLVHHDFNPRNIALRRDAAGFRLVAYDWELATLHLPQHDLAELLCFVLTPETTDAGVTRFVEAHRRALEEASGFAIDPGQWRSGFGLCLMDLAVNRFAQYVMVHTFRQYGFMERVIRTLRRLITLELGA